MSEPPQKKRIKRKIDRWCRGGWAEAIKPREVEIDRPDGGRRHCLVVGGGTGWWRLRCLVGEGEERICGVEKPKNVLIFFLVG
jgi:hypothetical protein